MNLTYLAILTGIFLMNVGHASSHSLVGYEKRGDGRTVYGHSSTFQTVSAPEKEGWHRYSVILNGINSFKDDDGEAMVWVQNVKIWFKNKDNAENFSRIMSTNKATDLYYNFNENKFNKTVKSCSKLNLFGLFCSKSSVQVINYKDLTAKDVFAYDAYKKKNIPLLDYIEQER